MSQKRQENPVLEFVIGCLMGPVIVLSTIGGEREHGEVFELDDANGGIVLFTPTNVVERSINGATGRNGYSHVGMLLGLTNDGGDLLIVDSQPSHGIKASPLSRYEGRRITYIPLDDRTLAHARGGALSRLGKPYRGRRGGLTCGEFVAACMPTRLKNKMRERSNFVTPNSIAKAFGIETGGTETVTDLSKRLRF